MQLLFAMEHNEILSLMGRDSPEVPSLIKFIASNEVAEFDSMEDICGLNNQFQMNDFQPICSSSRVSTGLLFSFFLKYRYGYRY